MKCVLTSGRQLRLQHSLDDVLDLSLEACQDGVCMARDDQGTAQPQSPSHMPGHMEAQGGDWPLDSNGTLQQRQSAVGMATEEDGEWVPALTPVAVPQAAALTCTVCLLSRRETFSLNSSSLILLITMGSALGGL